MRQRLWARGLTFGSAAIVALWGAVGGVVRAGEVPATPSTAPAMRVYVDPKTGAILHEPPQQIAPEELPTPASQSGEGLVERPAPGGGVMIDLQGRFMSPITATAAPDGAPHVECHGPQPGAR